MLKSVDFSSLQLLSSGNKSNVLGIEIPPPRFSYALKKKTLSLILVLDLSQKMEQDNRWTRTRDALFRLVSHMPIGSELGIITVGSNRANVNIEPTVVRESNREGLHGRIPYRLLNEAQACIKCGIAKAKELLNPDQLGSILIVSADRFDLVKADELDPYIKRNENQVPIHLVYFDETIKRENDTRVDEKRSQEYDGGAVYKVPNTPRVLQSLSSIFLSLLKVAHGPHIECTHQRFYHFEANTGQMQISEDSYEMVSGNSISGNIISSSFS